MNVVNPLNLSAELGTIALDFAVAKYIEGAGSAAGAMTTRAKDLKAIATEVQGVAEGTITIAELETDAAAALTAKGLTVSEQILVTGLVNLLSSIIPSVNPTSGLLGAALAGDVNLFATQVISICNKYIA